ncbi:MAG: hypothetical protein C0602_08520 [Denitrovibrio sp.]|nr:MAG: hypothetical protein C0602_08520 [Denitrovibrio sp.]
MRTINTINDLILELKLMGDPDFISDFLNHNGYMSMKEQSVRMKLVMYSDQIAQEEDEYHIMTITRDLMSELESRGDVNAEEVLAIRKAAKSASLDMNLKNNNIKGIEFISSLANLDLHTKSYFCQRVHQNLLENSHVDQILKAAQIISAVDCSLSGLLPASAGLMFQIIEYEKYAAQIAEIFTIFDLFLDLTDMSPVRYKIIAAQLRLSILLLNALDTEGRLANMQPFYKEFYPDAKANFLKNKQFLNQFESEIVSNILNK